MIRFGTPVFDFSGENQGILLFNYLGKTMLDKIDSLAEGDTGRILLLNLKGTF